MKGVLQNIDPALDKVSSLLMPGEQTEVIGFGAPLDSEGRPTLSIDEVNQLIIDHLSHGERLAKSFLRKWRISLQSAQITSVVGIALSEAANRFDPTRGVNFKTFFFYHLKGLLVKDIKKMIDSDRMLANNTDENGGGDPYYGEVSEDDSWPSSSVDRQTPERLVFRRQMMRLCWRACAQLDELEQEVLIRHFVHEESMTDIADALNYSRCHISRVKTLALTKLGEMMRRLRVDGDIEDGDAAEPVRANVVDAVFSKNKQYSGGRGRKSAYTQETRFNSLVEYLTELME